MHELLMALLFGVPASVTLATLTYYAGRPKPEHLPKPHPCAGLPPTPQEQRRMK
jgi:hypothetical protein